MASTEDKHFDTIVLGSGISGLSAAVAARKHGLRTLLLESDAHIGGGTAHSYGLIWVGSNHLAAAAGIRDPRESVLEYMRFLGGGQEFRESMERFIDEAPRAVKFFEGCGIRFRLVNGVPDHYYGTAPSGLASGRSIEVDLISGKLLGDWAQKLVRPQNMPYRITAEELVTWGGVGSVSRWDAPLMESRRQQDVLGMGVAVVAHFLHAALRGGVDVRAGQRVRQLLTDNDRVTGVELADGQRLLADAGVVIATGGYESNPAMAAGFEGLPGWDSLFPASLKGDGLALGTRVGGAVHMIQNNLQLMVGFRVPVAAGDSGPEFWLASIRELCSPHTIMVNHAGQRFADEAYFQHVAPKLREFDVATHRHPNLPCFLIFDSTFAEQYSFAGRPAGAAIPDWVQRADTLEALAQKLGVDPQGLAETAVRFNRDVATGRDTAFARGESSWALAKEIGREGPRSLGAVARAPFYGIELKPASASAAGLLTDADGRVLRFDRRAVEGLYAVGNAAARTEFGVGYQAGYTLASGMTFGLLIAQHMHSERVRGDVLPG